MKYRSKPNHNKSPNSIRLNNLFIIVALFNLLPSVVSGNNLLKNPGFEAGDLTSWAKTGVGTVNSENSYTGNYSAKLEGDPAKYSNIRQLVSVDSGNKYQIRIWVTVSNMSVGSYRLMLRWYDISGSEISGDRYIFGVINDDVPYTKYVVERKAPTSAVSLRVQMQANKADGIAYFDDVLITDLSVLPGTGSDVESPSAPKNLKATPKSSSQIDLSWDVSTDYGGGLVAGYDIYRDGGMNPIARVIDSQFYSDKGLTENTLYSYTVTAFDNADPTNESESSNVESATTITGVKEPDNGSNLLKNSGLESGIIAPWSNSSSNSVVTANINNGSYALRLKGNVSKYLNVNQSVSVVAGNKYRVHVWASVLERTVGSYVLQLRWFDSFGRELSGDRVNIATIKRNQSYKENIGEYVAPSGAVTMRLQLQANKADGDAYFDDMKIVLAEEGGVPIDVPDLDVEAPNVPMNLKAKAKSSSQIDLSWDAVSDNGGGNVIGYNIYRDGKSTPIAFVSEGQSYSDNNLQANTTYYYEVSAIDNASPFNESDASFGISETTVADSGGQNLLHNWGLELGGVSSWSHSGTSAVSTSSVRSGSYSLRLRGDPEKYHSVRQIVPVVGGHTYRAEIWMSVSGRTKGSYVVQLRWFDEAGSEINNDRYNFSYNYKNFSYSMKTGEYIAPKNAVTMRIQMQANKSDGMAFFDDMVITDLSTSSPPDSGSDGDLDNDAPSTPTNIKLVVQGDTQIDLSWNASIDNGGGSVAGYKVYRNGASTPIAVIYSGQSYSDTGLNKDTSYTYSISAFDDASPSNVSSKSAPVSETTGSGGSKVIMPETNLLLNSGLEAGNMLGWAHSGSSVVIHSNIYSGLYALKLNGDASKYKTVHQSIPVVAGNLYSAQVWMAVENQTTGSYRIQFRWYDSSGVEISSERYNFGVITQDSPYKEKTAQRVAPPNAVSMRLQMQSNKADGAAYFDAMSLVNLSSARYTQTLLVNATQFESKPFSLISSGMEKGMSIELVDLPKYGYLEIDSDGMATYLSDGDYFGKDQFRYKITDINNNASLVTVKLEIKCVSGCSYRFIVSWAKSESKNVVGYKVYIGKSASNYYKVITMGPYTKFEYLVKEKGGYYFAISSVNNLNIESPVSKPLLGVF